jgi:2-iminobutanoate/2-iminopropanoate deaminase
MQCWKIAYNSMERVVPVTCFMADANAFVTLNTPFGEYFPVAPPVRSTPVVALPKGLLFLIAIDAMAVAGSGRGVRGR